MTPLRSSIFPLILILLINSLGLSLPQPSLADDTPWITYQHTFLTNPQSHTPGMTMCQFAVKQANAQLKTKLNAKYGIVFPENFHFPLYAITIKTQTCRATVLAKIPKNPKPQPYATMPTTRPIIFPSH